MVLHIIYFIVINKMFKNKLSSFHGSNVVSVKLVLAFNQKEIFQSAKHDYLYKFILD